MKKYICFILTACFLFAAVPGITGNATNTKAFETVPSRYASDAFCCTFENEKDFHDSFVPLTSSQAATKYAPGAGGSVSALMIRQDVASMPPNGNISTGINSLVLTPGITYKISVWLKVLSHENYKIAPNVHFFFMNNNTPLYSDASATTPVSGSGIFDYVTAQASNFQFYENDGTVTGEWRKIEAYYTPDHTLGSYYLKPGDKLYCNTFMRIGSNAHTICSPNDYTDAFLESITIPVTDPDTGKVSYQIDSNKYYTEYVVDDWSMEPYMKPVTPHAPEGVYNTFDSPSWIAASDISWKYTAATCSVVSDPAINSNVLQMVYAGNPNSYMEVSAILDKHNPLMFNRAYEISFRVKGSEAINAYFKGKQNYLKLIPERAYTDRLERTKHKWSETRLKTSITEEWQDVSVLWYEPTPHMLGLNSENNPSVRLDLRLFGLPIPDNRVTEHINGKDVTYIYSYQNDAGETVYADWADFVLWIDDFSLRPLDIVLNGDMAYAAKADTPASTWDTTCYNPGENPNLSAIFGSGTIEADASAPSEKALVLKKGEPAPGQKVEIDSKTDYSLTFWAKADSPESIGKHIFPVLDRSIQGQVRDNAVTDINPEGRSGYGNLTGETGDIPYYLYKGTVEQHVYHELNVKTGETLVYDDYFARMKSTDGYESQTTPSAWNYQYYNGAEWVSQNNDSFTAAGDDFALTSEWKKYTVSYRWDYEGEHYRLPRLSFSTDTPADFRLAGIAVEKIKQELKDPIRIENLHCNYNSRSLYVGSTLNLCYQYVNEEGYAAEGSSLVKLLSGDDKGNFAVSSLAYVQNNQNLTWEIPDVRLGCRVGFEIIPIAENGTFGVPQHFYTNSYVRGKVHSELTVDSENELAKIYINALFAKNVPPQGVTAFLSFYDKENRMIGLRSFPVEEGTFSETVPMGSAEKAKLIIMEDADVLIPCCKSNSDICFPANTTPFADTDTVTVAFLGGSSASGAGLYNTTASTYSTYVSEYLQDTHSDKTVQTLRYITDGATTTDGLAIARDVLSAQPDLIFIDYTTNDGKTYTKNELTALVETLTSGEKVPYIIFLYTGDNNHTDFSIHYQEVAEQHKIPHIDLRKALSEHLNGMDAVKEGYMLDALHPTIEGHIVYATAIIDALSAGHCFSKIR